MIHTYQARTAPVPMQAATVPTTTNTAQFDFSTIISLMLPMMIIGAFMGMIGNMFSEGEGKSTA